MRFAIEDRLIELGFKEEMSGSYNLYINEDWYIFFETDCGELIHSGVNNINTYYDITKESQVNNLVEAWKSYKFYYNKVKEKEYYEEY